ncbi:MAG TPA: hypothetical protein VNT75_13810 [Symbiobacteriaceae bacterium]|nr:hypothetical protein [Symbiobacteriaceae bacterium]
MLQIRQLALRDFQGHIRTDLTLGSLTFVKGANGAGKSSTRRALEWLLTGQVSDLGLNTKSATNLLMRGFGTPEGAQKATVVAVLTDDGRVMRELPKGFKAKLPPGGEVVSEDRFRQTYRLPRNEVIALACCPSQLADLKPDEVRDLLFAVLTDGMARDEVLKAVRDWAAFHADGVPGAVDALVSSAAAMLPDWPGASDLDRLYKEAYGRRREANGAVRALKQQLESLSSTAASVGEPAPGELDRVKQQLTTYRTQAAALHQRLAEAEAAGTRHTAAVQAAQAAEQRLTELRIKTGLEAGNGHPGDEAGLRGQISALTQQIRTAKEQNGACPVYHGVACPLPATAISEHVGALSQQKAALVQDLAHVVIYEAAEQLQAARAHLAACPATDPHETRQELERINALIDRETQHLERLAQASGLQSGTQETAERIRRQLAEAEAEAAKWSLAVKCFDTDGVRSALMHRRLHLVADRINQGVARVLGDGWAVHLAAEGTHPLLVRHPKHSAAPLKTLSTAERTLVSVVILDALNDFHDLGLLCIDDAEHLTGPYREALFALLRELAASGRYGTILVCEADSSLPGAGLSVTTET